MNNNENARPASLKLLIGVFAGAYLVGLILYALLTMFVPFDNAAMGLIITGAAAGMVADTWLSREKVAPPSGRAWQVALLCGVVATVVAFLFAVFAVGSDAQMQHEWRSANVMMKIIVFAGVAVAHMLMARLGFWWTFRRSLKKSKV